MFTSALGRLAAFVFLTLLMTVGLHLTISWSLKRVSDGELGAFNQAMQGRVNADILIAGSSRAFRHYDPRIITRETGLSSFNLGRNASQIDVQLGVLKAYLQHNKKPRLLLQNLDIQSFVLTKPGDIFDPASYVPYLDDSAIYSCLSQISPQLWKWKYLPLYAYATEDTLFTWTVGLRTLCGLGPQEPCFEGFCPMQKSWTNEFDQFKRAHPQGIEVPIDAGAVAALKELIAVCEHEKIKLVLVYSPQYQEMIGLTRNRAEIFALFTSIAEQSKIPLLDYTHSPISQTREYFYNSQHLNARGAAIFSEDLAQKLVASGAIALRPD